MVHKFCFAFICVVGLKLCLCQRRITHGRISDEGRPYMVYLLNSKYSTNQPKNWLCGGALVSANQILTSAACLTEVTHMYAIAGYKKYVSSENIDKDKCLRNRKQRIIEIIIPKAFKKKDADPEKWIKYDVGVAVVEEPYNFKDTSYTNDCSYTPAKIMPHFSREYEIPNTVALIFGWGGTRARKAGELQDLNSPYLQEARTVITNISFCSHYVNDKMKTVVDSALLCAFGTGYSSPSEGEIDPFLENCLWRRFELTNPDDLNLCVDKFETKRRMLSEKLSSQVNLNETRRRALDIQSDAAGICENDHGGPLISFFGSSEVVIGIALTSIHKSRYECEGPFLYLSFGKVGWVVQCLLAKTEETRRFCRSLSNANKKITVNWPDHKTTKKQPQYVSHAQILREQTLRRISKQTPKRTTKRTQKRAQWQTTKRTVKHTLKRPNLRMRVTISG